MADYTPNAGLAMPRPLSDVDKDRWGNLLNDNWKIIDSYLGEIIQARGGRAKLGDRLDEIDELLRSASGPDYTIVDRLARIDEVVKGPYEKNEEIPVYLTARAAVPLVVIDAVGDWYNYEPSGTFKLNPGGNSGVYVCDQYGRIQFIENSFSIYVSESPPCAICYDLSSLTAPLVVLRIDSPYGIRSSGGFGLNLYVPLGIVDENNTFIPCCFKGICYKEEKSWTDSLPSTGTGINKEVLITHNLGDIPVRSFISLITTDETNTYVHVVSTPKVQLRHSYMKSVLKISNLVQSDLRFDDYTPTKLKGYIIHLSLY